MYRYGLVLLFLIAGCRSAATVEPTTMPSDSVSDAMTGSGATMIVHGMGCPMCANNIDKQLLKVPGVRKVNVDLGSGTVSVQFAQDQHPARQKLVDAVQQSGFTLVEIR